MLNIKVLILLIVLFQLSLFLRIGGLVLVCVHLYRLFHLVDLMMLKVNLKLGKFQLKLGKLSRTEADFHERRYPDFILHTAITLFCFFPVCARFLKLSKFPNHKSFVFSLLQIFIVSAAFL